MPKGLSYLFEHLETGSILQQLSYHKFMSLLMLIMRNKFYYVYATVCF